MIVIVRVSIVEGDGEGTLGKAIGLQRANGIAKRQHIEMRLDPSHPLLEFGLRRFRRTERIVRSKHTVVDQHSQTRTLSPGGERPISELVHQSVATMSAAVSPRARTRASGGAVMPAGASFANSSSSVRTRELHVLACA